ncbi:lytic transglycosylase domain-containing protein [Sphingomonas sp. IC4-52]|uniref:lytic transglycosylase domain-containing protein n=1 Tax=Sphingomonas sp. IC4-52 TaxID=2887202 RepID=UPI001D129551|nr:lytic transglycosylase domain-containing protein [Sphingomonas sp. IC4-52]MCC2979992.1 lytic transglycosylase domain-containing protein [Sphingomonas sp. IC4-52]
MTVNAIYNAAGRVQSAIQRAAAKTGIDFDYLVGQAKVESGFNATARARTSSASGLYQFIEQSWLAVVKNHGAEHGMGWAADGIQRNSAGRLTVSDPGLRRAILDLRNNPEAASLMAAEHASDNKDALEASLGRDVTGTDLYMAHFLGLGGAKQFLKAMQASPDRSAASMFPAAAGANRNVFFNRDGSARSLSEVYERFGAKLGDGAGSAGSTGNAGNSLPRLQFAAQMLDMEGATVITGANQSASDAMTWANAAMGRTANQASAQAANLLRPSPDNARLAYMMLASMGG